MPHVEHIKNCKDLPSERKHKEDVVECDEVKASPASNYESLCEVLFLPADKHKTFQFLLLWGRGRGRVRDDFDYRDRFDLDSKGFRSGRVGSG